LNNVHIHNKLELDTRTQVSVSNVVNILNDIRHNIRETYSFSSCKQVFESAPELTEHKFVHMKVKLYNCSV